MKSVLIGAVALMAIVLPSCNKEVVGPSNNTGSLKKHLVKQAWSGYYKDTTTYEYDGQDRLTKVKYDEDTYTYSYNGNTVAVKDFRPGENRLVYDATTTLDINKRINKVTGSAAYLIDKPYTLETIFQYDDKGYLLQKTETRSNNQVIKWVFTWINGDISKIQYYFNGTIQYSNVFEYYATSDLTGLDHYKFESAVTDIVGVNSKHLVKKSTSIYTDNTPNYFVDYTYTLDGQGYPVKATIKTSYGDVSNAVYTYNK